jgi:hypothetical protein
MSSVIFIIRIVPARAIRRLFAPIFGRFSGAGAIYRGLSTGSIILLFLGALTTCHAILLDFLDELCYFIKIVGRV